MAQGRRKPYLVQPDVEVPAEDSYYSGVGAQLREARQSYGRTTAEIGAALRIKPAHLDALERGETDGTPGLTYALGYLRSYATFLGLDGEAAVAAFKAELNRTPEPQPLNFPAPVQEAKFPTGRVLSLSIVLAVLVYGGYYYVSRTNTMPAEVVPSVPAELAEAPAPQPGPGAVPAAAPAVQAPASSDPTSAYAAQMPAPAVEPAPSAAVSITPTVPVLTVAPGAPAVPGALPSVVPAPPGSTPTPLPTDVAAPPPVAVPAPATTAATTHVPSPNAEGRVVLKATDAAWVQVQGAGNEILFTKILRAGDTYVVPARPDVVLVTGNAGAVEVIVDGKSLGSLGAVGQVRRNVPLDPEKLLEGAAKPPA